MAGWFFISPPSQTVLQRTEWNIRDSDVTVIFTVRAKLTGGSKRTAEFAAKHGKPCLHLHAGDSVDQCAERLTEFLRGIRVLNVAGSRGSNELEVGAFVRGVFNVANG